MNRVTGTDSASGNATVSTKSHEATVRAQLSSYVVDVSGAALVLGVSERQFYELRKREGFPRARRLSERVSRYVVSELLAWLAKQPAAITSAEPPQLVRGRVYRDGKPVNVRPNVAE